MDDVKLSGQGVLLAAVRQYGGNNQIDVAIEEMAELTQALIKTKRYAADEDFVIFRENVIEEIADVEIMLQQLRLIFGIDEGDVDAEKDFKLSRLADRLKQEGTQ